MVTIEQIESLGKKIADEFQPERIVLFGSYAYGRPDDNSDVDLLVVLPFVGRSARKAVEIRERIKPNIPVDLMVRTPQQVAERISQNDWFMQEIVRKGRVIYETVDS